MVAAVLVAVRTERAVAKVSGGPHTPLPLSPASRCLSLLSPPSLLPNKVPELWASGMTPSLSSGIRVRHLERGRWERKKRHPNINPLGPQRCGAPHRAGPGGNPASRGCIPET